MQPNGNDPLNPGGHTFGTGQPPAPAGNVPRPAPAVPDWQQGLGTIPAPAQSVPSIPSIGPTPSTPASPVIPQPVYGTVPDLNMSIAMPPAPKRSFAKLIIAVVAVVVILAGAAVGYLLFTKGEKSPSAHNAAQTSANNATNKSAITLDNFASATLAAPADMSGFDNDLSTGSNHDYPTTGSNAANGGCELAFGTSTATELPGATIDDIVTPNINALKSNGVTVDGPKAGAALILKDNTGKEYSLPTITYTFTQGAKTGKTNYGVVITKDGNRTYVRWSCAVNGPVDNSQMNQLARKASQITVVARP